MVETVRVIREGHPNEYVVINKADLLPGDKLYGEPVSKSVEIKRGQAGKYNVLVDGSIWNSEPLSKAEAEAMAADLSN